MISNIKKRKLFELTALQISILCLDYVSKIVYNNLSPFLNEEIPLFIKSKTEEILDRLYNFSIDKYREGIFQKFKEDANLEQYKFKAIEIFCISLKKYGEIITERLEKYIKPKMSSLIQNYTDEHTNMESFPFEIFLLLNATVFEDVITIIETSPDKECVDKLTDDNLDGFAEHVLDKYRSEIELSIQAFFFVDRCIYKICETIKDKAITFFSNDITSFISQEWTRTVNYDFIINDINKDILIELYKKVIKIEAKNPYSNDKNNLHQSNIDEISSLKEKHFRITKKATGFTYENIFGDYLENANKIILIETYIRKLYQYENIVRFCQLITKFESIKKLHLITNEGDSNPVFSIKEKLSELTDQLKKHKLELSYEILSEIHDREIIVDNGWTIKIGRGLDIYRKPTKNISDLNDYSCWPCRRTTVDIYKSKHDIETVRSSL